MTYIPAQIKLVDYDVFYISYLVAKARWITTKEGKRLQVPTEEFHRESCIVYADSELIAIRQIKKKGYLYRDIIVE